MSIYAYSAADKEGKIIKEEQEAEDKTALARLLKEKGFFLIEAKEKKTRGIFSQISINGDAKELLALIRPIGLVDKMFFVRDLGVMIRAGVSLTRALEALAEEATHPRFREVINNVKERVIKGETLALSMQAQGRVFGDLFVHMVEAGEASGKLALVLRLLARQMKKDYDLRKRVIGAMVYPAIIIIALFVIGILMMVYVMPTISKTIQELQVDLPLTTQMLIALSNGLVQYGILFILLGIVGVLLLWYSYRTPQGREFFDKASLRIPIFGDLVQKYNTARLCRILAYLLTSGIPIIRSLEITASILGNTQFRRAVESTAIFIQKGETIGKVFRRFPSIFPPLVVQMVEVGEETGKVSSMLLRLALFFEEDIDNTTKNMSAIIEPILMIAIGCAVAFFALSVLQPIYSSLGSF